MATNLLSETRLTLSEAAQVCGVSTGAVVRWSLYGIRGGSLKLESYRLAGKRYTTQEAIERFIAAQNPDTTPARATFNDAAEQRIKAAEAELAAHGI
jgi:hypothetical protein